MVYGLRCVNCFLQYEAVIITWRAFNDGNFCDVLCRCSVTEVRVSKYVGIL